MPSSGAGIRGSVTAGQLRGERWHGAETGRDCACHGTTQRVLPVILHVGKVSTKGSPWESEYKRVTLGKWVQTGHIGKVGTKR